MIKYCLSSRQPKEYLEKADEIFVSFNDYEQIEDLAFDYPSKTIILQFLDFHSNLTLDKLLEYKKLCKNKLVLSLPNTNNLSVIRANKIPFFLDYQIRNFYELNAIIKMGVKAVFIDAPLFFNYKNINNYAIEIRLVPHIANKGSLEHDDGVCGSWIRPEDSNFYEPCTFDFSMEEEKRAQALYRIYALDQRWPGDLKLLVQDLNYSGINRLIDSKTLARRLDCGQMCQETKKCNLCYTILKLANPELLNKYKNKDKEKSV